MSHSWSTNYHFLFLQALQTYSISEAPVIKIFLSYTLKWQIIMILSLIVQLNVSSPALMDSETSLYPTHEEFLFSICKLIRQVFVLYLAQWEERVWLLLL